MSVFLMLKRILRTPSVIVMLAVTFLCIFLCGALSEDDGLPSCGIVCGSDPIASAITDSLADDGMVFCKDEAELVDKLQKGKIVMGMILPNDLTKRLEDGNTDGMMRIISTPMTFLPSIQRYRVSAYIIEEFTPYLMSSILKTDKFSMTPEEMKGYISAYLTNEESFAFSIETVDGRKVEAEHYSFKLTKGAVALLLFFAIMLFAVPFSEKQATPLFKRLGLKKGFFTLILPSVVIIAVLFAAVASVALILSEKVFNSGVSVLVYPTVIYTVFLSAAGVIAIAIARTVDKLRVLMIAICMISIGFCPIFADISAIAGIPKEIRYFLPPMFFYAAMELQVLCAILAAVLFTVSMFVLYMAYRKRLKLV